MDRQPAKNGRFDIEKEYISIFELSIMISIPVKTLRNWLYAREMPFPVYRINRHVRFKIQEVRDWMETRGKEPVDKEFGSLRFSLSFNSFNGLS